MKSVRDTHATRRPVHANGLPHGFPAGGLRGRHRTALRRRHALWGTRNTATPTGRHCSSHTPHRSEPPSPRFHWTRSGTRQVLLARPTGGWGAQAARPCSATPHPAALRPGAHTWRRSFPAPRSPDRTAERQTPRPPAQGKGQALVREGVCVCTSPSGHAPPPPRLGRDGRQSSRWQFPPARPDLWLEGDHR